MAVLQNDREEKKEFLRQKTLRKNKTIRAMAGSYISAVLTVYNTV